MSKAAKTHLATSGWEGEEGERIEKGPASRSRSSASEPMTLDLALGFSSGELDLVEADVKRIDFDGGFNDLTVSLGAPKTSTRLEFNGAFNRIELIVPPEVPVSVDTEGLLNLVDGRPGARRLEGPGYRLSAEGAFNTFTISSP